MSRQFNFIFKELTDGDPNNILGLIAYSIYKNDKIKFIEEWKSDHPEEDRPSDESINHFHKDSMRHIDHYRELAEKRMTVFMEDLVSAHIETYRQIEKDVQKETWSELLEEQKAGFEKVISTCQADIYKLQPSWKTYAWSGIVGNVAFLVFLAGLFFILGLFGNDLAGRIIAWVRGIV